jgi:type IV pilus assembly protein PilQ
MRTFALTLAGALAATLVTVSGREAADDIRLKAISTRVNGSAASVLIEASEPVAYVAARPDPLTLLVDFRGVDIADVSNAVAANPEGPITAVTVEALAADDGTASRVRVRLAQPLTHRIRSDRSTIIIDFDNGPVRRPPSTQNSVSDAPDAMVALSAAQPAVDPIAALGLDAPASRVTVPGADVGAPAQAEAVAAQAQPTTGQPQPPAQGPPAQPPAPTAQGVPPPADQPVPSPGTRRYTGNPVSLDFQGADLRAVLRTFAEISGLNMVIDPRVSGTVDVALRDVPWDQALDIILRANGLDWRVDGTIVRIAPRDVFTAEDKARSEAAAAQALAGDTVVMTRTLSYAKAQDLVPLITRSALSVKGSVLVDPRTNTLIITDLPERLPTAQDLIATLDRPQPQVEIEARIVQTTKNYARALGIQWGFAGRVDPALGNTTNLAFPNSGSVAGRGPTVAGGTTPSTVNLPVAGPNSIGLSLGSINGAFNQDVALTALENEGNARLLSTPRVTTQNNIMAEIAQGVTVPFQTTANNTVTTTWRDAALVLRVQPQITASNTVILNITVDNGSIGPTFNGVPSINTQRALTTVQVSDGETTVLGGIYSSTERETSNRTPGLSRIPFLKWLFKSSDISDEATELLIFITPRIVKI